MTCILIYELLHKHDMSFFVDLDEWEIHSIQSFKSYCFVYRQALKA